MPRSRIHGSVHPLPHTPSSQGQGAFDQWGMRNLVERVLKVCVLHFTFTLILSAVSPFGMPIESWNVTDVSLIAAAVYRNQYEAPVLLQRDRPQLTDSLAKYIYNLVHLRHTCTQRATCYFLWQWSFPFPSGRFLFLCQRREHGYFVASWWRTPLRHPPKVTRSYF
jgi:hypothetical protein